jgi:hypothetical protein
MEYATLIVLLALLQYFWFTVRTKSTPRHAQVMKILSVCSGCNKTPWNS